MDLQEIYKEESGYDVGKYNIDNTNYYSEDYVEWLEKQLRIGGVIHSVGVDEDVSLKYITDEEKKTTDVCGLCKYDRSCSKEIYEKCVNELHQDQYYV